MNREIKFRGIDPNTGEFVYGCFVNQFTSTPRIVNENSSIPITVNTLGQSTGLYDKNKNSVFEGDLLAEPPQSEWDKTNFNCHEVFFHGNDACSYHIGWQMDRMHCHGAIAGGYTPPFKPSTVNKLVIIGNIHQNPELVKR